MQAPVGIFIGVFIFIHGLDNCWASSIVFRWYTLSRLLFFFSVRHCYHRATICLCDTLFFVYLVTTPQNSQLLCLSVCLFFYTKVRLFFIWILKKKRKKKQKESIFFLSELCWICETKVASEQLKLKRMLQRTEL